MASISLKYKSKSGNLTAPGDVDPGAMIPIATTTVSTATPSVTFSSIPDSYAHLQLRMFIRSTRTGGVSNNTIQFNGDTGNNYAAHYVGGQGSVTFASDYGTSQPFIYLPAVPSTGTTNTCFGILILDLLDYANTNKNKTFRCLSGYDDNGSGYVNFESGLWMSNSAVNSFTIKDYNGTNNIAVGSTFALYGIKRAGA